MDSANREAPLVMLLVALVPSIAVAVRVADALWLAAGVVLVMVGTSVARSLLERGGTPTGPAAGTGGGTPAAEAGAAVGAEAGGAAGAEARAFGGLFDDAGGRWLRALVISSLLTAAFEAGLLAASPAASASLGIYAPLVAVNLLVVGRAGDRGAGSPLQAALWSLRRGAWFAGGLAVIALVREVLGAGTITLFPAGAFSGTITVSPLLDQPVRALGFAGGGLLCLGYLVAAVRAVSARRRGSPAGAEAAR